MLCRFNVHVINQIKEVAMGSKISIGSIARISYEVARIYCTVVGKRVEPKWEYLDEESVKCIKEGVKFITENPELTPKVIHKMLVEKMEKEGWKYGPMVDTREKVHPEVSEYSGLPRWVRIRDRLVFVTIRTLLGIDVDE
jgi:hypothetical protein